jgi:hypothetical protein
MNGTGKLTIEVGNAFLDEAYARAHAEVKADSTCRRGLRLAEDGPS